MACTGTQVINLVCLDSNSLNERNFNDYKRFVISSSCSFIADSHIPLACQLFIEERGRQLLELNLYRNFMLHVINMYDFSLISPSVVVRTLLQLDRLNDSMAREGAKEVMKEEKVDMVGGVGTSEEDAEVAGLVQDTTEGVGES